MVSLRCGERQRMRLGLSKKSGHRFDLSEPCCRALRAPSHRTIQGRGHSSTKKGTFGTAVATEGTRATVAARLLVEVGAATSCGAGQSKLRITALRRRASNELRFSRVTGYSFHESIAFTSQTLSLRSRSRQRPPPAAPSTQ